MRLEQVSTPPSADDVCTPRTNAQTCGIHCTGKCVLSTLLPSTWICPDLSKMAQRRPVVFQPAGAPLLISNVKSISDSPRSDLSSESDLFDASPHQAVARRLDLGRSANSSVASLSRTSQQDGTINESRRTSCIGSSEGVGPIKFFNQSTSSATLAEDKDLSREHSVKETKKFGLGDERFLPLTSKRQLFSSAVDVLASKSRAENMDNVTRQKKLKIGGASPFNKTVNNNNATFLNHGSRNTSGYLKPFKPKSFWLARASEKQLHSSNCCGSCNSEPSKSRKDSLRKPKRPIVLHLRRQNTNGRVIWKVRDESKVKIRRNDGNKRRITSLCGPRRIRRRSQWMMCGRSKGHKNNIRHHMVHNRRCRNKQVGHHEEGFNYRVKAIEERDESRDNISIFKDTGCKVVLKGLSAKETRLRDCKVVLERGPAAQDIKLPNCKVVLKAACLKDTRFPDCKVLMETTGVQDARRPNSKVVMHDDLRNDTRLSDCKVVLDRGPAVQDSKLPDCKVVLKGSFGNNTRLPDCRVVMERRQFGHNICLSDRKVVLERAPPLQDTNLQDRNVLEGSPSTEDERNLDCKERCPSQDNRLSDCKVFLERDTSTQQDIKHPYCNVVLQKSTSAQRVRHPDCKVFIETDPDLRMESTADVNSYREKGSTSSSSFMRDVNAFSPREEKIRLLKQKIANSRKDLEKLQNVKRICKN